MLQNNLLRRKISFSVQDERRSAADKVKKEAAQAKSFFKDVAGEMADFDSPFDTVSTLAEVRLICTLDLCIALCTYVSLNIKLKKYFSY